jgi:hypothetical protein
MKVKIFFPGAKSRRSRAVLRISASQQAGQLLVEGKAKFQAGDRMGALALWERSLNSDPDPGQRQAALFNATCVHAAFGDVELAQITLREAVQCGLDFSKAVEEPAAVDPALVRLVASQQVLIRLRKFNEATLKAMGMAASPPPFAEPRSSSSGSRSGGSARSSGRRSATLDRDLSQILGTDMQGIDTSAFGIVKRVGIVLVALAALGVVLYVVGINTVFPDEAPL